MKGKILIVLAILMVVTGMILASCDNGAYPDINDPESRTTLDTSGQGGDPTGAIVGGSWGDILDNIGDEGGDEEAED